MGKEGGRIKCREVLRDKLESEERIEAIVFGSTGAQASFFSRGYTLCLTDRRLLALRCRYLTGLPVELVWSEPPANVKVEHIGKIVNTSLSLRRLSDGKTLRLNVGRPWNDGAAKIAGCARSLAGRDSEPEHELTRSRLRSGLSL